MLMRAARVGVFLSSSTAHRPPFGSIFPAKRIGIHARRLMTKMEGDDAPASITAAPLRDQLVQYDGKILKTVQEGKAYILVPPNARTSLDPQANAKADDSGQVQNVFYNPIQQFNRDLSVLAINAFAEDACERKKLAHAALRSKKGDKRERKRKREESKQEAQAGEQETVKVRKTADDSATSEQNGASGVEAHTEHVRAVAQPEAAEMPDEKNLDAGEHTANGKIEPSATGTASIPKASDWKPRFRILDALSATGLRALRYASEVPYVTAVVANDRDANAVKNIDLNVQHNRLTDLITTTTGDALRHMYGVAFPPTHTHGPQHISGKYDVIDLDPYGTAAPFIDAALQALEDGGMLCVTCTDSGVFASCGYSEKTFSLYGGMPIKGSHSHEGGLRLIIHSVATSAAKYGIAIEPLLSLSIDYYVRIFIRIRKSAQEVKFLAGKTMLVYGCDHGCGAWSTQFIGRHTQQPGNGKQTNWKYSIAQAPSANQLCEHCGSKTHLAGPMWGGPLHNAAFIEKILHSLDSVDGELYQTKARVEGMLDTALDELSVSSPPIEAQPHTASTRREDSLLIPPTPPETRDLHPFFFIPSALVKVIKAQAPAENLLKGALRHAGYRATRSHCKPGSVKTDAPWTVIWEVLREWVRQRAPVKEGSVKEGTPGWKILQQKREDGEGESGEIEGSNSDPPTKRLKVVFDENLGKDKPGKRLIRYQMNPRENWGPMSKAKGHA
ncbi:S-adenosyl-L-methionine-dependent methyltransferase [Neohortaea acidophila]|uniref:tRNA (guanine(26)-N(2))-dimethyltransferase n=1 Tax=Neohortaea acidophila TaxID=245834 RepID=A0A6A6Q7N7_9PEZI|nr:S-adenosyl-L-methionine-dependent methyltransferase [Neohortaea acidophila]KAF2487956.1 S-adenosyl-L-methionine-dependent methyltransferase [Neohortaea acidophila]